MSEPMFGGVPAAPQEESAPAESSSRKPLLIVGGVVAAVALAGVAFMALSGGGSSDDDAPLAFPKPKPSASVGAPSAEPSATPVIKPATVKVSKRDPFAPLAQASAAPSGGSTTPATNGGSTNGGSTPNVAPTATPTTAAVTLALKHVREDIGRAWITVDGKKFWRLTVGESFGGYYSVYSIFNDQCVGVLYGDQSVPLCKDKPVTVTP